MATHKFTPGPWKRRKKWGTDEYALEVYPCEKVEPPFIPTGICEVNDCRDEAVANARLISAAPDLLASIQEYFTAYANEGKKPGWCERVESAKAKVNAAIKKATGEESV